MELALEQEISDHGPRRRHRGIGQSMRMDIAQLTPGVRGFEGDTHNHRASGRFRFFQRLPTVPCPEEACGFVPWKT